MTLGHSIVLGFASVGFAATVLCAIIGAAVIYDVCARHCRAWWEGRNR